MSARRPLVIVAMSGGVDSAVAALLLQEQGFAVQGLFMSNWTEDEDGYCTTAEDYQDARRVCALLEIPLHKVSFAAQYRAQVFDYFLRESAAGRTPNPDVLCNREIKFGACESYAWRLGADLFATGHYARVVRRDGRALLFKGLDAHKDQSYFLHGVDAGALQRVLFPLGELTKTEVRQRARAAALPVFDKKDSTGICFIGERPFQAFLSQYLPAQPGAIESTAGVRLGTHQGLMYYTLGQRQGLGIGGVPRADDEPWYVAGKDLARNTLLVVQGHEHPLLFSDEMRTGPLHWLVAAPAGTFRCAVKTRYRQPDQECEVTWRSDGAHVRFAMPQRAVTPGQFAVFYDGECCLGGAVIEAMTSVAGALGTDRARVA